MQTHLLHTKLTIPRMRMSLVARTRLNARLDEALPQADAWRYKLTLVSAPAGYGKTTLLCQWLSGCSFPVAWLSLDETDNDPTRFLTYLATALQQIDPKLGRDALEALRPSAIATAETTSTIDLALTLMLNEIVSHSDPIILVLDDYHVIEDDGVHQVVSFLLDNQPPQLHLVIATRVDPPLPLARLRAQAQMAELHAADLCFTIDEATVFLNETMELDLTAEQAAALEQRTEGWIAGLQLAALALQGTLAVSHQRDVPAFIQAFTGSHRFVLDYLTEEVLNQQTEEIQRFLLSTALLDRLTAPLCEAVTGNSDSQRILERLDAANLFIISLDDERRWYRYHHLFADLLRQRLQRERRELIPELHARVSAWYEDNGFLPDAVKHALSAEDFQRAARLIKQNGRGMLMRGEMNTLLPWLDALPPDLMNTEPALAIFRAWALAFTGQWEMMENALTAVNEDAAPGEVTAVRAYVASVKAEVAKTYELAEEAMAQLPEDADFLRALVQFCVGITHFSSGRPAAASQALDEVIRLSRAAGHPHLLMTATVHLGHIREMQGLLHQALQTHHEALRLTPGSGGRPVPFAGIAHVGIAEILYEWNDLDEALRHATEGVKLTKRGGFVGYMLAGYACLIRIYRAQGNFTRIEKTLQKAERLAEKTEYRYMQGVLAELRVRLWMAQENLAAAQRWARAHRLRPGDKLDLAREVEQMVVARILLAQATNAPGDGTAMLTEVQALLSRLLEAAEAAERTGSLIKILALRAAALQLCGQGTQALSVLARAFSLARPEKYVRTFVDEGAPMARLLRKALAEGIVPDYAATLLAAFDEGIRAGSTIRSPLVEPLSERELEVLRLIVAGLSNREIAGELVIAISTVKSHINNIYGKLGVASRDEAILRARVLRLL